MSGCDNTLAAAIRRDVARYNRKERDFWHALIVAIYNHPAFAGLIFYRISRGLWLRRRRVWAAFFYAISRVVYPLVRMYSGVEIHPRCEIGPGAFFGHFGPIVIHPDVRIGEQITIMQGVTLGETRGGVPRIGAFVSIGVSSVVAGPVTIGDYAVIAAGAVVVWDVAGGCVVGGVPARPIGERRPDQYDEVIGTVHRLSTE